MGFGEALFSSTLATLENVGKTTMDTVSLVVSDVRAFFSFLSFLKRVETYNPHINKL